MASLPYTKFAVFLAFVFGCNVASSQSLIPFADKEPVTLTYNETNECDSQFMCNETKCNDGKLCREVQYARTTCNQTTNKLYCNHGVCSEEPPPHCNPSLQQASEFTCPMVDGVYPDLLDCRRYHICVRGVRTTNKCPINNVYDHQMGSCKYQRFLRDCVLFKCMSQNVRPIVYPQDDRIYGKCVSGTPYITGRCQEYERYNLSTEKCERYCRSASTQPPDPGNCGKFILCAEVAPRRYRQVEMSCGCDQGYDEKEKRCVLDAPCVKDTPEIWCTSKKNKGEPNGSSDNGNDNGDFGKTVNETTEAPTTVVNNIENSNSSDNENRQSKNSKFKNIRSAPNKRANQQNNDNNFNVNIVTSTLINDNRSDNNNNVDNNDDVDVNLISADNNDNNDNDNPEIKQRENFVRYVFNWIIRITMGQNA